MYDTCGDLDRHEKNDQFSSIQNIFLLLVCRMFSLHDLWLGTVRSWEDNDFLYNRGTPFHLCSFSLWVQMDHVVLC